MLSNVGGTKKVSTPKPCSDASCSRSVGGRSQCQPNLEKRGQTCLLLRRTSISWVLPRTGLSLSVTQKIRLLALGELFDREHAHVSSSEKHLIGSMSYNSRKVVMALAKTLPITVSCSLGLKRFGR